MFQTLPEIIQSHIIWSYLALTIDLIVFLLVAENWCQKHGNYAPHNILVEAAKLLMQRDRGMHICMVFLEKFPFPALLFKVATKTPSEHKEKVYRKLSVAPTCHFIDVQSMPIRMRIDQATYGSNKIGKSYFKILSTSKE